MEQTKIKSLLIENQRACSTCLGNDYPNSGNCEMRNDLASPDAHKTVLSRKFLVITDACRPTTCLRYCSYNVLFCALLKTNIKPASRQRCN